MVETAVLPEPRQVTVLKEHNLNERGYVPWYERAFGVHSRKLIELGELNRPNLHVVELGAGPNTFLRRAMRVAARGGHFTAVDLDRDIVGVAQQNLERYTENGRIKNPKNIDIQQGDSNRPLEEIGVARETADVVIINSVAANASPAGCKDFLHYLYKIQTKEAGNQHIAKATQFLDWFIQSIPDGVPSDFPLEGVQGNVLILVNAFLTLKEGGTLVYSHNDQSMTHAATQQIRTMCDKLGFPYDSIKIHDPLYNMLPAFKARDFDMGIVTAKKKQPEEEK